MRIERRFTEAGKSPYEGIAFRKATSEIRNPDGSVVFKLDGIEVPQGWSQVACDILAQKYFRKAGVAAAEDLEPVAEDGVPEWLWRKAPKEGAAKSGERTSQQVFDRLAGTWTYWGWKGGYFDSEDDARAFRDELAYMLANQMCAPNSPQWFNTGLHWAYGIDGPAQGHFYVDYKTGEMTRSASAYEHPQPHACFIQGISDDLVNEGGIMDLWVREARLFKYGSGTGSNFSALRAANEPLSGGGKSSGLMSFLKIGDRAAGAIKSGGTTRRAAKMVVVDADHPDIEQFIRWKAVEEQKVAALVSGSKLANRYLNKVMEACHGEEGDEDRFDPAKNKALRKAILAARKVELPENYIRRVIDFARQGYTAIDFRTYDTDWDSDAYLTVSEAAPEGREVATFNVGNEFVTEAYTVAISNPEAQGVFDILPRGDGEYAVILLQQLDYETQPSTTFTVSATGQSSGDMHTATVSVDVLNVNEAPSMAEPQYTATVVENTETQVLFQAAASDPDAALAQTPTDERYAALTFSLAGFTFGSDAALFTVDPATGVVSTTGPLDYESRAEYTFEVVATDGASERAVAEVVVTVDNVNEKPTFIHISQLFVYENAEVGTVVGQLSTVDPDHGNTFTYELLNATDLFAVDGDKLVTAALFDFSGENKVVSMLVRSTDQGALSVEEVITVRVVNENDAPTTIELVLPTHNTDGTLSSTALTSLAEDTPTDTVVGVFKVADPDAGDLHIMTLVDDADGTIIVVGVELVYLL